jgi:hypothetical protein
MLNLQISNTKPWDKKLYVERLKLITPASEFFQQLIAGGF